jgi:hypothetical protein
MERKPIYQSVVSLEPLVIREFISFKKAQQIDSIAIIKKEFREIYKTHFGREHDLYNYFFLERKSFEEENITYCIENWSIEDIYEGHFGEVVSREENYESIDWAVGNYYIICDQNGEVRKISFESPEEALIYLRLLSKYKGWAEFDLEKK